MALDGGAGTKDTEMQTLITKRSDRERGAILILSALTMILLLAIAAFATDLGAWYRQAQQQQRAADVGSLNAVQAYDTEIKDYIDSKGKNTYSELTPTEKDEAEVLGMQEAVSALLSTLGANGSFLSGSISYNPDPVNATASEVTATFSTTDGATVTLTRNATDEIIVTVNKPGTQYFSSVLRDAPDIGRTAVAVISNCNADCSREIELVPPFQGFTGTGDGDGFRPSVGNNGRIWTVNHSGGGGVVCMDSDTQAPCAGWAPLDFDSGHSWDFGTARKPEDTIDNVRDQLYFTADEDDDDEWGIVCVDTVVRQYCPGAEFTKLHDFGDGGGSPAKTTGSGVFMVGDRLFAMGMDGTLHCVDPDDLSTSSTVQCSGYPKQTSAYGESWMPELSNDDGHTVFGEIIDGKLYFYIDSTGSSPRGTFICWNPSSDLECWNRVTTNISTSDRPIQFVRYDTSTNPAGFCIGKEADYDTSLTHTCVNLNGTLMSGQIPNLAAAITYPASSNGYIYGEGFSLDGELTLFGSRRKGNVFCYSWVTQSSCGTMVGEEIYGMTRLTEDCVIAVGHTSKFTSINPRHMTQCTGTSVTTTVYPCDCGDGVEKRYGVLELPQALINVLNSASATATGGGHTEGPHDLLAGPMDLSPFNGIASEVTLTIEVDSKTAGDGSILWQETYSATLALTVQPTLAR